MSRWPFVSRRSSPFAGRPARHTIPGGCGIVVCYGGPGNLDVWADDGTASGVQRNAPPGSTLYVLRRGGLGNPLPALYILNSLNGSKLPASSTLLAALVTTSWGGLAMVASIPSIGF